MKWALLLLLPCLVSACSEKDKDPATPIRVGYFPNITHAQALVGKADGTFNRVCSGRVTLHPFNAGPAAMEALLGDSIDMAYVGGGPALTAFVRSEGRVHVLSGAASGGSVLVVREGIKRPEELEGKRVSTPQLGNTQDIALRHFLRDRGMKDVMLGQKGVQVLPMSGADALGQFRRGELDGAWVPEPWGSRLIHEGRGHVLVDEAELWPDGTYPTTLIVATDKAVSERRALVGCVLEANRQLTERWEQDPAAFAQAANASFAQMTGHKLPPEVLRDAFGRLQPTLHPMGEQLARLAQHSKKLGYLPSDDTARLVQPLRAPAP